jgi:hypothetical protein
VIYSYNKNRDALFLKFNFDKELYMFRTDLPSIMSLNTVYTAVGVCHASYVAYLEVRSCNRLTSCFMSIMAV